MGSIVDLILESKAYVGMVLLAILVFCGLISESFRERAKKGLVFFIVLVGIGLGYYLLTGKPPSEIPGDINRFFSDPQIKDEPTHRYYKEPEERYGDMLPKE